MTEAELKDEAQRLGFELFGVAEAAKFPTVPCWTRSIVVLGMAALDPAWDLEMYIELGGTQRWSKWAYERLAGGASRLALALIGAGHRAQPLTYENSLALLDLKAAAIRAGLGVRGLNTLVVTRQFGPRVHWGAVFTDLALPSGRPVHDYYCASCTLCIGACPTRALGPHGLDRARCIGEYEPDAALAALQKKLLRFPTPHTRLQCSACIDACPIGRRLPTRFWGLDAPASRPTCEPR